MLTCLHPRRDWRTGMTSTRILAGVGGTAAITSAVIFVPESRNTLATSCLTVGFILLAFGFGVPLVAAADTGHPVGRLIGCLADRRRAMIERISGVLDHTLRE